MRSVVPSCRYATAIRRKENEKKNGKGRTIIFLEGENKNPEKNCLQKQKSPNKLFADMKGKNKKFADWLMESYLI